MGDMNQKDPWVVEVENLLDGQTRLVESPDGLIHKVPESLLRKDSKVFYLPQVLFLGPYHFKGKEKPHDEMELLKTEAARKVHNEIKGGLKSRKRMESGLISVMETFKQKEEKIKGSYAKIFEVTGEVCAWMMARDACFVLQVLQKFGEVEDEDAEKSFLASILSRKRDHPLLTEIVKDMLKMENQLPFWALQEIRPDIEGWLGLALKNLSPIEVTYVGDYHSKKKSHILQLLHDYIVGRPPPPTTPPTSSHNSSDLGDASDTCCHTDSCKSICDACCTCSCTTICYALCGYAVSFSFFCCGLCCSCTVLWEGIKELFRRLVHGIIFLILSPVVFIMFIIFAIQQYVSPKWEIREHSPTVEELKRLGVKFKKLEGKELGISHIKFKESNSTLYLPQFKVDNRSEVILRNLIALEICCQEEQRPFTRYAILMNDLINTSEDVGMLRREDVITSKLGSDEEIARFWNSMLTSAEVPRYDPIDKAVSSIHDYRKKWWKVLWAQFLMTHCSKPWLFLSLLAGLLLLLLTIVQVVCLFESCQIK